MKAALLTRHNAPLRLADITPGPLEFGQVLVRVLVSGICGAQLQEIRGEKKTGPLPHPLGHEGCGIVEDIGAGVTRVKRGDKVVMHWRKAAGIESAFPKYFYPEANTHITGGLVTTFSEKSICSENRLTPVPPDTDPHTATLLGCSLSTAMATVESEAKWGERVLVIGCGGLGIALLAALDMVEPRILCACDIMESKRLPAEIAGADFLDAAAIGTTPTPQFDLILDTAGAEETADHAIERLAPSGRYVMIGQPKPGKPICVRNARHLFEGEGKTIKATQGGGFRPDLDIPRYLKIAQSLRLWPLVTHTFQLDQINHAFDLVRAGEAGRVLIEMGRTQDIARTQERETPILKAA
jgi:S-(hydroxymethyl)glutathione dehydrogenase/alcohol dehydrogenase